MSAAFLPAATRTAHLNRPLVDGAALVLLPALFLYCGLFQRYPLPGWVDPGIYLGYFFDLPGLTARYGFNVTTYHGTRLSWVVPGYWLHQALPAALAQQALVALMYFPSVWAAYLAGRGLGGRLGGHLAAAFIAYNPLVLAAVTFGAVDGVAITYLLGAAACLFASRSGPLSSARLLGFGALSMAAAVAHPFALAMAGLLAMGHVLRDRASALACLRDAGFAVAGAALAFVALALVGTYYGFRFWFPLDSVAMAQRAVSGIGYNYRIPVTEWLFSSYRLLIPCLLLATLLLASRTVPAANRRLLQAVAVMVAGSSALFLVFDLVVGGVTLQVRNYTNLMLPACALALAAFAGLRPASDTVSVPAHLLMALPAVAVAGSYALYPDWLAAHFAQFLVFGALVVAGLTAVLALTRAGNAAQAAWHLTILALVLVGCGAFNQDSASLYIARTGVKVKDAYIGASRLVEAVRTDPALADHQLLFWYRRDGFTTGRPVADRQFAFPLRFGTQTYLFTYYDTLSSLYLYDRSLLGDAFPAVDETKFMSALVRGARPASVVLVSQREDDLKLALGTLERRGFQARVRARHAFDSVHFGYTAWVLEVCGKNLPETATVRRCA